MLVYLSFSGIGLGHASRSVALARKIRSMGLEVILSSYGDGLAYAKREARDIPILYGGRPSVWEQGAGGRPDVKKTVKKAPKHIIIFWNHLRAEVNNVEMTSPDLVVSDSRVSTLIAGAIFGLPQVALVNQPRVLISPMIERSGRKVLKKLARPVQLGADGLLGLIWSTSRAVIVPDFPPPFTIGGKLVEDLPRRLSSKLVFVGPLITRPPAPDSVRGEVDSKPRVLALISGPERERKDLLRVIESYLLSRNSLPFRMVISSGDPKGEGRVVSRGRDWVIYDWLPDKWTELTSADVVLCRAGHTTIAESLMAGKPLILIPVPGHTEKEANAASVESMGLGKILPQEEFAYGLERVVEEIVSDDSMRSRLDNFVDRFSRWDPLDRAASIIAASSD